MKRLLFLTAILAGYLGVDPGHLLAQPTDEAASEEVEVSSPPTEPAAPCTPEAQQSAESHADDGAGFMHQQNWAAAAAELAESVRLCPSPRALARLAAAYERLGRLHAAIEVYEALLEAIAEDDPRRPAVESKMSLLESLFGSVEIQVNTPALVTINGEERGNAPGTFRISSGQHRVTLRAEGYEPAEESVVVASGTFQTLEVELVEVPTVHEVVRVTERRRIPKPVFWATLGVTSASAVAWIGLSLNAMAKSNAYSSDDMTTTPEEEEVQAANRQADIMLGVTAALAVTTLVVGLLTEWDDEEEPDEPSATPSITAGGGRRGFQVDARWRF